MRLFITLIVAFFLATPASALEVQKVTDGVYALVGEMKQRSKENLANNATFGVVVTDEGIVLIDSGGSWLGAAQIETAIKTFSDRPVKIVINSGGQDHRWLGNGFWKAKGAKIIASENAVADQKDRVSLQFTVLEAFLKEKLDKTDAVYADTVFAEKHSFKFGGLTFDLTHAGAAHTPGDAFVWVKEKQTVFTGDIVYVERILGIGPQSSSGEWIKTFKAMAALKPVHVVPGHGHATTLAKATADTLDYLVNLRKQMAVLIENGGDMIASVKVDQKAFSYLKQFKSLAGRNAQQVFSEMEFE